jgi:malonyl-CoA O-methyltransferase
MPQPPPYQLDTTTGQRRFSQAAAGYDSAAVLQDLVRTELLNRLEVVQLQPTVVLDLGCGTGKGLAALLARYAPLQPLKERAKALLGLAPKPPQARVIGIDSAPGMLAAAAAQVRANPLGELLAADACALPCAAAHADLVFASLLLPWIADPDALFAEVRRVLRPGGLFAFATLGPDTLHELRAASKAVDDTPRVLEFTDMPELARGLQQAGFADPVLDRDLHRLTYSGTAALFADLRALGATNRRKDRAGHLTGRGRIEALSDAYEIHRDGAGRLPVTCEVIYGHAWVPAGDAVRSKRNGNPSEVVVPLSSLRRRP